MNRAKRKRQLDEHFAEVEKARANDLDKAKERYRNQVSTEEGRAGWNEYHRIYRKHKKNGI